MSNAQLDTKPRGVVRTAWRRLRADRAAVVGLIVILAMFVLSYLAPMIANDKPIYVEWEGKSYFPAVAELFPLNRFVDYPALRSLDFPELRREGLSAWWPIIPHSPTTIVLTRQLSPPSADNWMGTDDLGRDVASRMIHGAGVSLKVGLVAVSIAVLIGLVAGGLAGFYGGRVDMILSRVIEVMMCFPVLFLILAVIAFLPPSIFNIMVVIGLTRWTGIARYARAEFMRAKQQDYAFAARAIGGSDRRIIVRHILPNSLAPVLVAATFGIANAILIEAALSFLGLGIQPPMPSWGGVLAMGKEYIQTAWWLALFPGLAIFVTVSAYNILGEGLRDATDPRAAD